MAAWSTEYPSSTSAWAADVLALAFCATSRIRADPTRFQDVGDLLGERLVGERLGDHLDARIEAAAVHDRVARVAGRIDDFEFRLHRARPVRELAAGHPGHHHVGEHKIDRPVLTLDEPKRGRSVVRLDHAVAKLSQDLDRIGANVVVVLHDENAMIAP